MINIKAKQAESPEFRLEFIASDNDIDELGHVSNVAFVRWIQDVAKAHSAAIGYDHEAYKRIGRVFVVRKHEVEYLSPAYAGERIALITHVAWWRAASSERRTRIIRVASGEELVRAATLWAFVSTENGRPRRIQPEVVDAFRKQPRPFD
ncbi:MAG: acyl-CoA thioesterase [Deltaproteobacteria bacterium]|nr:acyl-CoA thioesterase [Deltaproteobacteria bacterium]